MSYETWLIGLLSAVIGAFAGHYFTVRLFRERVTNQEKAYYSEFALIRKDFLLATKFLIEEYKHGLDGVDPGYREPREIDFSLIDVLTSELASSDKPLTGDQRALVLRFKSISNNLRGANEKRSECLAKAVNKKISKEDAIIVNSRFKLATAELLAAIVQIVFYSQKLLSDKRNFVFGKYSIGDCARVACNGCEVGYDELLWNKLLLDVTGRQAGEI